MRFKTTLPAAQLQSSAGRYRLPVRWMPSARRPMVGMGVRSEGPRTVLSLPSGGRQVGTVRDAKMAEVEAVLFVAKQPLHARKVAFYANLADGTEARTLMLGLNQIYDQIGCAFRIVEVAGGWQLRTRRQFGNWIRRLPHAPPEIRLSAPAMETLAVVAYRQPVTRADIESIRGVSCGEIIRQLMERDLVAVAGRSDELGRPYFYGTTKKFLEVFGLQNIEGLPRYRQMNQSTKDTLATLDTNCHQVSVQEMSERGDVAVKATAATADLKELPFMYAALAAEHARAADEEWVEEDEWDDDEEEDDEEDEADDAEADDAEADDDDWDDDEEDWDDDEDDGEEEEELEAEGEDEEWVEVEDDDEEEWDDDEDDDEDDDFDDDEDDDWEEEEDDAEDIVD